MLRVFSCALLCLFVCSSTFANSDDDTLAEGCAPLFAGDNPARVLAEAIMNSPNWVHFDQDRATDVAKAIAAANYDAFKIPTWDYPPYPNRKMPVAEAIRFLLVCDAINYRYIADNGAEFSLKSGEKGAGLMVQRVRESWATLQDPARLATLTDAEVAKIFHADVPMPDLPSRRTHLNEVGAYLLANPDAGSSSWLDKHRTPVGLAMHLADAIPGFGEPFLKRAQLFVGMLIGRFRQEPGIPPAFTNAGALSVYADYVLPSTLNRLGILRYHPDLQAKIQKGELLAPNSPEEMEIRAATIVASDYLLKALLATGRYPDISILGVDFALWIQAKEIEIPDTEMPPSVFVLPKLPYHRTPGTAY